MTGTNTSAGPRGGATPPIRWGAAGIVLLILLVVLWGRGDSPDAQTAEVSAGQALFEANCMECHGPGALGDGPLAASLPVRPASILDHLAHHSEEQLVQLVRAGIPPAMPPAPISEDEVRLVIEYVWTLVPESERAALRAMQESMSAAGSLPMPTTMPGMDHSGDSTPSDGAHAGH